MRRRLPWVAWALSSVIAAWLLWMTLRPNRTVAADLAPLTESAGKQGIPAHLLIDFAGNIAVFLIQMNVPSRVAAVDDWLLNTLGVCVVAWRRHKQRLETGD